MAQWYNVTNVTANSFTSIGNVANDFTGGWFGLLLILGFWLTLLIVFASRGSRKEDAFASASFITAIISILMIPLGWIQEYVVYVAIFFAALGLITLFWANDSGY